MQAKFTALFTTASGLSLVATFIIAGLTAVSSRFTGSALADITTAISILGIVFHPVEMQGGHSMKS